MVFLLALAAFSKFQRIQEPPRGVGSWNRELGDQRVSILVTAGSDAVMARILWRRRDLHPEQKQLLVISQTTGKHIKNMFPVRMDRMEAEIVFQPESGPGRYFLYTLPTRSSGSPYFPVVTYLPSANLADVSWLGRIKGHEASLPEAKVEEIESWDAFHRFDPMELIAGESETRDLVRRYPDRPFLVFPEDRVHPIRMNDDLPKRWVDRGPSGTLFDSADRGEYYSFQLGIFAPHESLAHLRLTFGDLQGPRSVLPRQAFKCFNLGGIDWLGRPFTKVVSVEKGKIAALWCGIQIPPSAVRGIYRGTVMVSAMGLPPQKIHLNLMVSSQVAKNSGDDDPADMSRLRWLDSKIGLDDRVVAPYTPLKIAQASVDCLGREVRFGPEGLPVSISSNHQEILSRPVRLVIEAGGKHFATTNSHTRILQRSPGVVTRRTEAQLGPLAWVNSVKMEADGYANYRITLTAKAHVDLTDIRLEIPIRKSIATYQMGMGCKGGYRPPSWRWDWSKGYANNMVWLGGVQAGIQCKLKGTEESWDLYHLTSLPDAWNNRGKGGCEIALDDSDTVLVKAYSGPRSLEPGQRIEFNFALLITPVKPLDPAHWNWRYDHELVSPETAVQNGATLVNVHQGNPLNPNINYPFLEAKRLAAYVKAAHAKKLKVKIYYTVRELSNYTSEIWALRSLGHEVFTDGPGGGDPWLQEHLVDHYQPAWHTPLPNGKVDAAITTVGLSRWHNYYLEGLRWLIENVGIDGLYLDGIGYDREIMKRVRKVMDRARPGCLIDFHSGNNYSPDYGMNSCASMYMEHFPYISSLWFGEGFNYNETPDYWLVEVSGLPFGLYGEMLQDNGNPWRGMIYGMTARYYSGANPKPIWQLWDRFGIAQARMVGYWDPACPVRTGDPNVLATAYVRKGKTLVSIASWAKEPAACSLEIDWKALGLRPEECRIIAPEVAGFQPGRSFKVGDPIPVDPGRGWLLEIAPQ